MLWGLWGVHGIEAGEHSIAWLTLTPDVLAHWHTRIPADHPSVLYARPQWPLPTGQSVKTVLVLVSKKSSSYSLAASKLLEVLHAEDMYANVTIAFIDFDKEAEGKAALHKAEADNVDVIFSIGSETADFMHQFYKGGKIPVVTSINKDPVPLGQMPNYHAGSGSNIATTSLNVPLDIQLSYVLELKPNLQNIGLMYHTHHRQVIITEVLPAQQEFQSRQLQVIDIAVDSPATSATELTRLMPQAIETMRRTDPELHNSIFWVTSATAVFDQIETISRHAGMVPVIGTVPNMVQQGDHSAVLAIGIDRRNNAHLASIYAVKILRGEAQPGQLKVGVVTPPDIAINFRIARKIGLKIPFRFFESAAFVYDHAGDMVRAFGQKVAKERDALISPCLDVAQHTCSKYVTR
jgi:putative ABC transport system substrate-binding protein